MNKHGERDFAIVGMNVGDKRDQIQNVFRLRKLGWNSFYFGQNYTVPDNVGVQTFPTYMVLDQDLKIRSVTHSVDYQMIDKLLSQ